MIQIKSDHKEIDSVIFDIGNVLMPWTPRLFMFELGISPELFDRLEAVLNKGPMWEVMDQGKMTNNELIEYASKREPGLKKEISKFVLGWPSLMNVQPDNIDTFYRCKENGCEVFILSNFSKESFESVRRRNAFFEDADGIIVSSYYKIMKPMPEIYQLLLKTYSIAPEKSVFIDDIEENIKGAEREHINGIVLPENANISDYFEFPEEKES